MKEAEEQQGTDTPPRVIQGETILGREEQPPKDGPRP